MQRKTIGVLFMLNVSLGLLAGAFALDGLQFHGAVYLVLAVPFVLAAAILGFIAWIGMLINLARAQAWTMFVLAFFFSGIILLIYLLSDAQVFAARTPAQLPYAMPPQQWPGQPGYIPPAHYLPAAVPVRQPGDSIFKYGVIAGGVLQIITILWYVATEVFFLNRTLIASLVMENPLARDSVTVGVPLLLSLPVFFLCSRAAVLRTNQSRAGRAVALRAYFWWLLINALLLLADILSFNFLSLTYHQFYTLELSLYGRYLLLSYILPAMLLLGIALGVGTLAGSARSGQAVNPLPK